MRKERGFNMKHITVEVEVEIEANEVLAQLDDEDIKYLSNKYLPKLQKEMEREVNKIKQRYGE